MKLFKKVLYWSTIGVFVAIAALLGGSPHVPPARKEGSAPVKETAVSRAYNTVVTKLVDVILYIPMKIVSLFTHNSRKP